MSYRKRVKLLKGVHLNLSGSGIGIGFNLLPGISFSMNKNGIYNNASLPGTGLYKRTKLASFSDSEESSSRYSSYNDHVYHVTLGLDEDDKMHIIISENGEEITDEDELRRVKRREDVKAVIAQLQRQLKEKIDNDDAAFINIYKHTEHPVLTSTVLNKMHALKFIPEELKPFEEVEPTIEVVREDLEKEAEEKVSSILFWTNKTKRQQYVADKLHPTFEERYSSWNARKSEYEINEKNRVDGINAEQKASYDAQMKTYEIYFDGDEAEVSEQLDVALSGLSLPCEFSIDYDLDLESGYSKLNLDLPEIEDLPKVKANYLASGKISVKDKTKKEIAENYATCVTGLAFFFSGILFNISSKLNNIEVSGYTQRLDGKTGDITDQYIYRVTFDRETFRNLKFETIIPYEAFGLFPHKMELTKQLFFKTILI